MSGQAISKNAGCPVLPVEDIGMDVIQAPKPEPRIMRDELTDFERAAIVCPRVPDAVQRPLRCSAEPGPSERWTRRMGPGSAAHHAAKKRRAAQRPGHER